MGPDRWHWLANPVEPQLDDRVTMVPENSIRWLEPEQTLTLEVARHPFFFFQVRIPILTEVRWARTVPFPPGESRHLVGLMFLL